MNHNVLQETLFEEFVKQCHLVRCRKSERAVVVRRLSSDHTTPVNVYDALCSSYPTGTPSVLLESVPQGQHVGRWSFVAASPYKDFQVREGKSYFTGFGFADDPVVQSKKPLYHLDRLLREHSAVSIPGLPEIPTAIGYVGFEAKRLVESWLSEPAFDQHQLPDIWLQFYNEFIIFDHVTQSVHLVVVEKVLEDSSYDEVVYEGAMRSLDRLATHLLHQIDSLAPLSGFCGPISTNCSERDYTHMVNQAKKLIKDGDVMQLVVSQRFRARYDGATLQFYRHLRGRNPSPYMYLIDFGQGVRLCGASPEVLVDLTPEMIHVRPIAGTRRRGQNTTEDEERARELATDPKELAEHMMLVDLARNVVGVYAQPGSVRVVQDRVVENYSTVMHLVSDVRAQLKPNLRLINVFMAAFPAGTLAGMELLRAIQRIAEIEGLKRGPYGGAVGFFTNKRIDTGICIRSALFIGEDVYWQAGGGIVADSTPEGERLESFAKAASIGRVFDTNFGPDTVVVEKTKERS